MGRLRTLPPPWVGLCAGVAGALAIALVASPFRHDLSRAIPGLLLVLPVVLAAILGGRLAAVATGVVATAALNVGFMPPVGSARVAVGEDAVALGVFGLVAIAVGTLVAGEKDRRRDAEQQTEEIREMHARFQAVVAEREQLRQEADRVAVMEQVDAQRAALLRSVSHDLRTPLASIRAVATDLRAGAGHTPAVREELLGLVCDQAERLDRIVANLLSLSRIEAGAFQPDRQAVDLEELLRDVTGRLGRLFDDIRVDWQAPPDLPLVDVDYVQIDQVLSNLLENAARYSPRGGTVRVRAAGTRNGGPAVEVTVSDDGPGIPEAELARVFLPFGANRPDHFDAVHGMGLALCKAIVEAHGGAIAAGNNPSGGACLRFTVPVRHG